jgi:putative hydrolase of the HAD superfamily
MGRDPLLADALSERYQQGQRSGHPLDPGAESLVKRALEFGRLGLITNGPPDIQRLKLSHTGLAGSFEAVLISGELGFGKPGAQVFEHALEILESDAEESVMVGDSWERDVEGALSAGLSAIWLSHGREPPRTDPRVRVFKDASEVRF